MRRWLFVTAVLALLVTARTVHAEADYAVPGRMALPWDCGQGYRVSWTPQHHWDHSKATGIAFDFALPVGVPIYAPFSGTANYHTDLRPLETTYGHYVDIIDETGQWLVRLAHLRDAQEGRRAVRTGDHLGHSGATGVDVPHLHVELLVRGDDQWHRPDLHQLEYLFGLPVGEFSLGAVIVSEGCPGDTVPDGPVTLVEEGAISLGEGATLLVTLLNEGPAPREIDLVQVSLFSVNGVTAVAEAQGAWMIDGRSRQVIAIPVHFPAAGEWHVGRLTYGAKGAVASFPARGRFIVSPAPIQYLGISTHASRISVGEQLMIDIWIDNTSNAPVYAEALFVQGTRPDGGPWRATLTDPVMFAPGRADRYTLSTSTRLQGVGFWHIESVGFVQHGREFLMAQMHHELVVYGPQPRVDELTLLTSPEAAHVFLRITNAGTELAEMDAVEIWGWKPNDESFVARVYDIAPLTVGQSVLLQIDVPLEAPRGDWRLVEAGYWRSGVFYPMPLPNKPTVVVPPPARRGPDQRSLPANKAALQYS